jgi:hypothetical protein
MEGTALSSPFYGVAAVGLLAVALSVQAVFGQQPEAGGASAVRPASFDRETRGADRVVQFGRRAACVGDEIEQTLSLEMRLSTSLRQGNELLESNRTNLLNTQRRVMTTTAVDNDRTTAVRVRYSEATKKIKDSESGEPAMPTVQPVQGKSYRCRRQPGEDGELIVTYENGETPPPDELEIVTTNMEMIGHVNPLAQLLSGRTVRVGETVKLPQQVAEQLFNLGDRFGSVTRFDLKLEKVEIGDGGQRAVFLAHLEAASNDSSQMRMQVEGPLLVQVETSRAVSLALSGPIAMSETRGSYSTLCQLIGTGQLTTSISSAYRDAQP